MTGGRRWRVAGTIGAAGVVLVGACGGADPGGGAAAAGCVQVAANRNADESAGLAEVVVVDDAGAVRLATADWVATRPSLSPDGDEMVVVRADGDYESSGPMSTSLWVIGTEGGADPGGRQLTDGPWDDMPAWSPDGTQVAFTRQAGQDAAVLVVPSDGGEPRAVVAEPGTRFAAPAWSPDGSRLAFVAVENPDLGPATGGTVWTAAADGSDRHEIVTVGGAHMLDWHPEGETLLVSTFASEDGGVLTVQLASGEVQRVAEHATMAAWAPDGDGVYYFADNGDEAGRQWRLAYGRVQGGRLERERFVGDVADYLYRYFGVDAGPCPSGG